MSVQAAPPSTPSFGSKKMDERKRPSENDDSLAPPAKRQATIANGEDASDIKFGPMQSPWQVDLETFQKDAIFRQMKDLKREKLHLEQQLADLGKRADTFDDRLITIDNGLQQLVDELIILVGDVKALPDPLKSQCPTFVSQLLSASNSTFKSLVDERFTRLKDLLSALIALAPNASPELQQLQKEVNRLLAAEKEHVYRYEKLQRQANDAQSKSEDYHYKWSIAKTQLAKAQSQTSQYMEMQTRTRVTTGPAETPKPQQANGEVPNGIREVNGSTNEEAELEKRAALAEVQQRKEQVESLESENRKLNEQLTTATARLNSLSDEDYAQTTLFKILKMQHEDVIKKIDDLEARNVQLREEAQKLQAERAAFRNQVDEECRVRCEEKETQAAQAEASLQRIRGDRDRLFQEKAEMEGNQTKHDVALREIQELNLANEKHISAMEHEVKRLKLKAKEIDPDDNALESVADLSDEGLKKEVANIKSQFSALNMEMSSMQTAVTKFRAQATKKVKETAILEQEVQRLREAKHRLESNRFSEKTVLEARKVECENIRRQSSKSAEIIAQLKEAENKTRELCANLEKQTVELRQQLEIMAEQSRSLNQQKEYLNAAQSSHETQVASWKKALSAKDSDLGVASHAQHEAEAEVASLKSKLGEAKKKVEEWKTKSRSDPTEEVQMLRTVAYCNTCNRNLKDTLIKSCGHILCSECAKSRIQNRSRKCPVCMKAFGTGDLAPVHLV